MTNEIENLPQLDLARARDRFAAQVEARWRDLVQTTSFVGGPEVAAFEESFAEFLEVPAVVGVANGTDALVVALRALELQAGAEVIVPTFTFVATGATVEWAGGRPVFADVESDTLNLDWEDVEERITDRTVGVVGVHLYGQPFDVAKGIELCRRHGLWLIEDAAQAHGARFQGRRVGSFGELATWSFYPSKNLGCFGDGGAVSGTDEALVATVRQLANHGRTAHYEHALVGTNSRLDALQAAVLSVRLEQLENDNERRRAVAQSYADQLIGMGDLQLPKTMPSCEPVFHQYTVRTGRRDELQEALQAQGIGSAVHYPLPLHQQPAFARESGRPRPVAEKAAREVLCLPMFAELTNDEVDRVCRAVRRFFDG